MLMCWKTVYMGALTCEEEELSLRCWIFIFPVDFITTVTRAISLKRLLSGNGTVNYNSG